MLVFGQSLVFIKVDCTLRYRLGFTKVVEHNIFVGEKRFKHVRHLKLSTSRSPMTALLLVLFRNIAVLCLCCICIEILCDINGVVHKAHFFVCSLMLKRVPVLFRKIHAEVDDFRRCIRNLDRVRLDVRHRETTLLHLVLQSAHK